MSVVVVVVVAAAAVGLAVDLLYWLDNCSVRIGPLLRAESRFDIQNRTGCMVRFDISLGDLRLLDLLAASVFD